jgi:hypothetical protein
MKTLALFLCMIVLRTSFTKAGLVEYGLCQSGCAGLGMQVLVLYLVP